MAELEKIVQVAVRCIDGGITTIVVGKKELREFKDGCGEWIIPPGSIICEEIEEDCCLPEYIIYRASALSRVDVLRFKRDHILLLQVTKSTVPLYEELWG